MVASGVVLLLAIGAAAVLFVVGAPQPGSNRILAPTGLVVLASGVELDASRRVRDARGRVSR